MYCSADAQLPFQVFLKLPGVLIPSGRVGMEAAEQDRAGRRRRNGSSAHWRRRARRRFEHLLNHFALASARWLRAGTATTRQNP
jgi:hypothetical protein